MKTKQVVNKKTSQEVFDRLNVAYPEANINPADLVVEGEVSVSEFVDTLYKIVVTQALSTPKWNYVLTQKLGIKPLTNGIKPYDYTEMSDGDNRSAYADNVIADANGAYDVILRETFVVGEKYHKKVKIPELITLDFASSANQLMEYVKSLRENLNRAIEKAIEIKTWETIIDTGTQIDITGADVDVHKDMALTLKKYKTTSKKHLGIGTDGVVTIGAETIQPELNFSSQDFILIHSPEFAVNITYDNDVVLFNWGATSIPVGGVEEIDFTDYTGMEGLTIPTGTVAFLIHKSKYDLLEFFNYAKEVNGASAFSILHTFSEYDVYDNKYFPTLIYTLTAPAIPPAEAAKLASVKTKRVVNKK